MFVIFHISWVNCSFQLQVYLKLEQFRLCNFWIVRFSLVLHVTCLQSFCYVLIETCMCLYYCIPSKFSIKPSLNLKKYSISLRVAGLPCFHQIFIYLVLVLVVLFVSSHNSCLPLHFWLVIRTFEPCIPVC